MFGLNELCLFYTTISETKIMYCLCYFSSFIQKSALFPSLWGLAKFQLKVTRSWETTAHNFSWQQGRDTPSPMSYTPPCCLLPGTENTHCPRAEDSSPHAGFQIPPRTEQHNQEKNNLCRNNQAKLPITNLKVDQMRCLLLREQKVFWWDHFFILVFLPTIATLGGGSSHSCLKPNSCKQTSGTLSASTHTLEEVFTSENEVRNKPLWFTSCQEYELKHTIRQEYWNISSERLSPRCTSFTNNYKNISASTQQKPKPYHFNQQGINSNRMT